MNVGHQSDGAIGNSDVDLAVGADDAIYFVTMVYDRKARKGLQITVGVSKNAGTTWSWTTLSKAPFVDRPWVGLTPDQVAHVIWNDGSGVLHAFSKDGGSSWNLLSRIHEQGGSSHLAMGPHGELAVRIVPPSASGFKFAPGIDLIAVSRDGGKTWQKHAAPGERDWSPDSSDVIPRWVEPVAWGANGALYYLWGTTKSGLWLARSLDQGETWTKWHIVDRDEGGSYYPYLIARGRGELAATWTSGENETLRAHIATIHVGPGSAPPQVIESQPFQTDTYTWSRSGETLPTDAVHRVPAGEYIPIVFLRSGGLGVVTTIQNQPMNRVGFKWWKFVQH